MTSIRCDCSLRLPGDQQPKWPHARGLLLAPPQHPVLHYLPGLVAPGQLHPAGGNALRHQRRRPLRAGDHLPGEQPLLEPDLLDQQLRRQFIDLPAERVEQRPDPAEGHGDPALYLRPVQQWVGQPLHLQGRQAGGRFGGQPQDGTVGAAICRFEELWSGLVLNEPSTFSPVQEHFGSMLDVNGDCFSDLVLVSRLGNASKL